MINKRRDDNLNLKQLKTKLAILGLIMVFSVPVLWNIDLRLITLSSQFYFYSFFAGMILSLVGIILISLSYSWILAAGAAFLAFGINRIMAGVHYSSFYFNDPISSHYISHYISVGYVFICIGILLIILTLFIRGKK